MQKTVDFKCINENQMTVIAKLIQRASKYDSRIYISREERQANAKSLLGLMSLGIEERDKFDLIVEGRDEEEAINDLFEYLTNVH